MADYHLVTLTRGPGWDHEGRRREQRRWEEHAAFMDARLADDPWMDDVLAIESVRPWSVWLRAGA